MTAARAVLALPRATRRGVRRLVPAPAIEIGLKRALVALPEADERRWVVHQVKARSPELAVVAVGPKRGSVEAIVKIAASAKARRQLDRERVALDALHATTALGAWRDLIPRPIEGVIADASFLAVSALRGRDARRGGHRDMSARLRAAAHAASPLATATAVWIRAGDAQVARWVREPVATLLTSPQIAGDDQLVSALERLEEELSESFVGCVLRSGFTHGDFWLGNLLLGADRKTVTGIVDWENARTDDLALLDVGHLLVTTRALVEGRELGTIVRTIAAGGWSADEADCLGIGGGDAVPARALVLFVWLRHVANNVSKRASYAGHRLWLRRNVLPILETFAR